MDHLENMLRDINEGDSRRKLIGFEKILTNCAKEIKSNDETFKISTLPEVSEQLKALMDNYTEMLQSLEASQRTFQELVNDDQNDRNGASELVNMVELEQDFQKIFEEQRIIMSNGPPYQSELYTILRQSQNRDEDIMVEEPVERQMPKDPITKKDIKKAVRSKQCKHTYDKSSIEDYFKQKEKTKSRIPCPVAGCAVRAMKRSDIEPDDEANSIIESLRNDN